MPNTRRLFLAAGLAAPAIVSASFGLPTAASAAATAEELIRDSDTALQKLYQTHPIARKVLDQSRAVLCFPNIVKAGFIFGAAYGEGVLREGGKPAGFYNTFTGSWGLQAGAQSYGYALFLMNDNAINYLHKSKGFEIGVGPTVVVVNEGVAKNLSSTSLRDDAYAFIFDQQGLMLGISLEGTKISRIER